MKRNEIIGEHKKGRRAMIYNKKPTTVAEPPKPRNPVAKNASAAIGGGAAGAHKDKKKAFKQGDMKHKAKAIELGEISLGDYSKKANLKRASAQMSKAFGNDRSPEHLAKLDRQIANRQRGLDRVQARHDKARKAEHERQTADLVARLPELKHEYEQMKAKYKSLGGSNWQYADREQNLTDYERKARSMEGPMNNLWRQIQAAEKAKGSVSEDMAQTLTVAKDDDKSTELVDKNTGVTQTIDKSNPKAPRLTQDATGKLILTAPGGQATGTEEKPNNVGKTVTTVPTEATHRVSASPVTHGDEERGINDKSVIEDNAILNLIKALR